MKTNAVVGGIAVVALGVVLLHACDRKPTPKPVPAPVVVPAPVQVQPVPLPEPKPVPTPVRVQPKAEPKPVKPVKPARKPSIRHSIQRAAVPAAPAAPHDNSLTCRVARKFVAGKSREELLRDKELYHISDAQLEQYKKCFE
jgi:outer membrane biosynthesis protein TonB